MQSVDVCLAAVAHGHVLDVEALGAPCAQRFDVEFVVLGRDVEHGGAMAKRKPAIIVGKVLESHGYNKALSAIAQGYSIRGGGDGQQAGGGGAGKAGERAGEMGLGVGGCITDGLYVGMAGVASQSSILLVQRRGGGVPKSHQPVLMQSLMTSSVAKPSRLGFSRKDLTPMQHPRTVASHGGLLYGLVPIQAHPLSFR